MSRTILLTATPLGRRAAMVDGGAVSAFMIDSVRRPSRVGDVHLGRVARIVPPLGGGFVELGDGSAEGWLETATKLAPGESVIVQVMSDARGAKGPRLGLATSLAGRALVLRPGATAPSVSGRITDEATRSRLIALLGSIEAPFGAFVARRDAAVLPDETLRAEAARLNAEWRAIDAAAATGSAPRRLWSAGGLIGRLLRDHLAPGASLVFDDRIAFDEARAIAAARYPDLTARLELADSEPDLFERHDVHGALEAARDPLVPFEGGRLAIETTEALTAIDVDMSGGTPAEIAQRAMRAAATEILRRNLGGLIVLDPPRLKSTKARGVLVEALSAGLAADRATHRVFGVTPAGLIELTRQRVGDSMEDALSEAAGLGQPRTPRLDALGHDLLSAARRAVRAGGRRLVIRAAPALLAMIDTAPGLAGEGLARWLGRPVERRPEPHRAPERFEIESA